MSTPATVVQPMTKVLAIVLAVAAFAVDANRTAAQGQGWCLNDGDRHRCGFSTLEQCLASRAGGSSHCVPGNPPDPIRPTRSQRRR
jgi:hypothetical protein